MSSRAGGDLRFTVVEVYCPECRRVRAAVRAVPHRQRKTCPLCGQRLRGTMLVKGRAATGFDWEKIDRDPFRPGKKTRPVIHPETAWRS